MELPLSIPTGKIENTTPHEIENESESLIERYNSYTMFSTRAFDNWKCAKVLRRAYRVDAFEIKLPLFLSFKLTFRQRFCE